MLSLGLLFAGLSIVLPMALFGLLVVLVVGVATSRSEPDPNNHRLPATYLTAVSFVLVFAVLFSAAGAVSSFASLIDEDRNEYGIHMESGPFTVEGELGEEGSFDRFEPPRSRVQSAEDDSRVEQALSGALVALLVGGAAAAMLWHYRRTLLSLIEREGFREGPGARVVHTYLYAVQFVAVLVLVGAAAFAVYGLAQIVAPGILSEADEQSVRETGARLLLTAGALAGGSAFLALVHMREHARLDRAPETGTWTPPVI